MERKTNIQNIRSLINPLGLGTGCLQNTPQQEIERIFEMAIEGGINYFDLCGGGSNVYTPVGNVLRKRWNDVFMQLHFGAVYDENGKYAWTRDLDLIRRTIDKELSELKTDHIDFGYLHCTDTVDDYHDMEKAGIVDYALSLQSKGVVRHIAFSSHSPEVSHLILDQNIADMMMFSINPAYEYEVSEKADAGTSLERQNLFKRCVKEKVGIVVMKPFFGGKLLDEKTSPFNKAMTINQCLQYALNRPGVVAVVPGVKTAEEMKTILSFKTASKEEKDYSALSEMKISDRGPECVYCSHCQPCPKGLEIALINKYYDLAVIGDDIAKGHYEKLGSHASDCIGCGHCNSRCPFRVNQKERMQQIAAYFGF